MDAHLESYVCKIMIADSNYSNWYFAHNEKCIKLPNSTFQGMERVHPVISKYFTKDSIRIFRDDRPDELVYSPFRNQSLIAGVLMLEQNKTFGRNATKKRLLYKCIPDDKHLPAFLVPYDVKLGFSKKLKNKYVVFKFDHWTEKHPHGILVEVLGDVDDLDVFYEYQLYCKSLHISLCDFNDHTRTALKRHTNTEYINIIAQTPQYRISKINPTSQFIFTIDPSVSTDFDDALSLTVHPQSGNPVIHVYIANVFFWMETLELWKSFSKRVSTIYLPDRKRPMLPAVLSEALCSLQQNEPRFAFEMCVEIDLASKTILPHTATFKNVLIHVSRNFVYEHPLLLDHPDYQSIMSLTQTLDTTIRDSHDLVSFWMVQMNQLCGEKMASANIGIFRAMSYVQPNILQHIPTHLNPDVRRTISVWNNTTGQYCMLGAGGAKGTDEPIEIHHQLMKVKSYIHITSPIRRIVDLLNQMIFMTEFGMIDEMNSESRTFLQSWQTQLDFVNASMRAIRKVQTDCEVLRKCISSPEILQGVHDGVVFDKHMKSDGTYTYMVYLHQIRVLSRISTLENLHNYGAYQFNMFVFEDETHIHKKIRLQRCANE